MQSNETVSAEEIVVELQHETMDVKIGYPAILFVGAPFPDIKVHSKRDVTAKVRVIA